MLFYLSLSISVIYILLRSKDRQNKLVLVSIHGTVHVK